MPLCVVPVRRRSGSTWRWTLSFFRPHRTHVAGLAVLSLAEVGLRAATPWPLKALIDYLVGPSHTRAGVLLALVALGLGIQLAHELIMLLHTRGQALLAQRLVFDLRTQLFTHLQYLSVFHHSKRSTADAVYRLDTDAGCLEHLLLKGAFPLAFSALTLVVMFTILLRLDLTLALISMAVVPALYSSLRLYARRMRPGAERAKQREAAVVTRVYESLAAIRLVKTFAREDYEVARFEAVAIDANRERMAVTRQESLFAFMVNAITLSGAAMVLAIGGLHVIDGQLTVGTLLMIVAYLGYVYGPLSAIATTAGSLHHALASAERVRELLALPRESAGDNVEPRRLRGEVRFEDVRFSYGPGRSVLDGITFTAKPGETVALVGVSGSGKTTLASLIGRMYEASSGRVMIDGVDVRRYRLAALRQQVAVVLQEAVLMSGTIADNLRYGRLDATEHEIVLAARAAHCEDFIAAMPQGFETPVGDAGGQLSGGQRQRLSIARAFLKDAPILILDEPTASLDTVSEQAVLAALATLKSSRTTFVIAHRLSTVRDADRILVLESGRIAAEGRHDELLASSPLYRRLCAQLVDPPAAAQQLAALNPAG